LSKTIGFCDLKFLANFALNYWPDGTRIETKRSHSPTVEGKESEKRASVVGFARVLVESERVENSNLKIFLFFTFFFALFPKSFPHLFETPYPKPEGESTNEPTPKGRYSRVQTKGAHSPAFFFLLRHEFNSVSNHKKQPTNSLVLQK
jgi:hypothetical protein